MDKAIFDMDNENSWCPGCGNFGILSAMKDAFVKLELPPEKLLLVSGIGQAGKTPYFLACNMFNGLHGRALPLATGAKTANHHLNVVVNTGDGDCYGEGGNHFLAAIRRDIDVTVLVHNNQVYGLTKGQVSPTAPQGMKTRIQSKGTLSRAFNPLATALVAGARFVARGYSFRQKQLSDLIQQAVLHKGFSLVDIFQPCVSFNKINTHGWYEKRLYDLAGNDHDPGDLKAALDVALQENDKLATGILYQVKGESFHEQIDILDSKALYEYPFAKEQMNDILGNI